MNIVFVSAEIVPYASTGGLADVAGALPAALQGLGAQVVRVMPMYRQVWEQFRNSTKDTGLRLKIPVGLRSYEAEIWRTEGEQPTTYFIRKDEYFDRRELYSLPERDYDDNFERFVFFQKAVVALIDALHSDTHIVHLNDWQTGLVPYFLKHGIHGAGREHREKSVFTIHNLAYQGVFPAEDFPDTNLPFHVFSTPHLEFYGKMNSMKAGIIGADSVTTVSRTYAKEILTPERGAGLEGVLTAVGPKLQGILNGVDYSVWDPAVDPLIPAPYSFQTLRNKDKCKKALLDRMGIKTTRSTKRRPVIGMVTRLVDQKGMDLLAEAMPMIMAEDPVFVLLGSGRDKYQRLSQAWAKQWPNQFAVEIGFNNELAHQIMAGADMFLMPSRYEPCGLNQLYGLRYGTVPIVHATGGLEDTIENLSADGQSGTGFKFTEYNVTSLLDAVSRALHLYSASEEAWRGLQQRGMVKDYSWATSARAYLSLYSSLL